VRHDGMIMAMAMISCFYAGVSWAFAGIAGFWARRTSHVASQSIVCL
jgi:hypothetical protein